MWEEVFVVYFMLLSRNSLVGLRKATKLPSEADRPQGRVTKTGPSEHKGGMLANRPRVSITTITNRLI